MLKRKNACAIDWHNIHFARDCHATGCAKSDSAAVTVAGAVPGPSVKRGLVRQGRRGIQSELGRNACGFGTAGWLSAADPGLHVAGHDAALTGLVHDAEITTPQSELHRLLLTGLQMDSLECLQSRGAPGTPG